MVIHLLKNDFFKDIQRDALVNTINCVGVMGKGIALEFKRRYPEMFKKYKNSCDNKEIVIGKMWIYHSPTNIIINFPTKQHWKDFSQYSWIEEGLKDLKETIINKNIKRIRVPALGCNNGNLDFKIIKKMIYSILGDLDADIFLYEPQ